MPRTPHSTSEPSLRASLWSTERRLSAGTLARYFQTAIPVFGGVSACAPAAVTSARIVVAANRQKPYCIAVLPRAQRRLSAWAIFLGDQSRVAAALQANEELLYQS